MLEEFKLYRKRPVVIQAAIVTKDLYINTLEGRMHADVGDYLIIGVEGERYPCKPDIFAKTYEEATEEEYYAQYTCEKCHEKPACKDGHEVFVAQLCQECYEKLLAEYMKAVKGEQ